MSGSVCVSGEGHSWFQAEGHVEVCACVGAGEHARERDQESTGSFSRDVAPSFSLPVTGPFNYPFSPSLTIRIAAPSGLICWRWAMALLKSAMYQMSGAGAVTSPAFVCPVSDPHRPLLPVWILLGKTFRLGQCVTCITQCWLGEDGKRKQEAKDLIKNMQMRQITYVGTSSGCRHSLALPELPSITPASCSSKTLQKL